jgi:methoxymalonate biosynthesis acyl carrier protein
MDNREKIRRFIAQFVADREIGDDEDIFALGIVTSLFAMDLVTFVESEFGITAENEDLEFANFSSISAIDGFVRSKQDAAGERAGRVAEAA